MLSMRKIASKGLHQHRRFLTTFRSASTTATCHRATSSSSKKPFDKILIANRGEIACRVIRTARRLGVKTVAVYSDADDGAEHVKMADEAFYIGASPASESYLNIDKIIEACKSSKAQAVHPGYGFLSESLVFCQRLKDEGIVFIGPPPNAIRAMGSKSESKEIMIAAGVPVTPGYHGIDQKDDTLVAEAKRVGYPLMIKAVSGGGGKGMRAVFDETDFVSSLQACRREALKSFGDDAVLIERLVRAPRHVELQVFGDTHGQVVHLLERDCSIQRRHQKVLEEAPVPNLDPQTRKAMGDAAVACAKAVGYVGAGTVEFLVDSVTNAFYFCEVNTRLQVEHPVTELITGLDLVEWQLRVAAGEILPLTQEQVLQRASGCAIEARIYAENPLKDFLPQTGHLAYVRMPTDEEMPRGRGIGARVDSGVRSGSEVSSFYDPMIAKLIVHAPSRPEALLKLEHALRDFQVAGVSNNIDFLVKILRHDGFANKQPTTAFFDQHMTELLASLEPSSPIMLDKHTAIGLIALCENAKWTSSKASSVPNSIWGSRVLAHDFRSAHTGVKRSMSICDSSSRSSTVSVEANGDKRLLLTDTANATHISCVIKSAELIKEPGGSETGASSVWQISAEMNLKERVTGTVSIYQNATLKASVVDIWVDGQISNDATHAQILLPFADFSSSGDSTSRSAPLLLAPMPGAVVKCLVKSGDHVTKGDAVVILNAMKMEHVCLSPSTGKITLLVEENSNVLEGVALAEIQ